MAARRCAWAVFTGAYLLAAATSGQAQTGPKPVTKIGSTSLVNPSLMANSAYSSARTNDTSFSVRPKEIVELANSLRGGRTDGEFVDQVYLFVRNNMDVSWTFGLQKGALGTLIDRSGTTFDQANLMVEVLKQGGIAGASYQFGNITLSGAQFAEWSGLTDAKAACQTLANGGIPAAINGSAPANCDYSAGTTITTVMLPHVWVSAPIGGSTFVFDPSFKKHTIKVQAAGLAAAITSGQPLAQATTGMSGGQQAGLSFVKTLNNGLATDNPASPLAAGLGTAAANVQTLINNNYAAGEIEDVVGGLQIQREYPTSPVRQTSLAYATAIGTAWPEIPDDYRTKLSVRVVRNLPPNTATQLFDRRLFVDDIYGRKLVLMARDQTGDARDALLVVDEMGTVIKVASGPSTTAEDNPNYNAATITLTVDHPYPQVVSGQARPGPYMDALATKNVTMWMPLVVVHGWGEVGRGLVEKWGAREDSILAEPKSGACDETCSAYARSAGDSRREQLAAHWLAQSSRAARLHAAIANARYTHHHSIGVVAADTYIKSVVLNPSFPQTSEIDHQVRYSFDRIDVDTGFSLTSTTGNASTRRAAVHAIAETLEVLEGSVAAQVADLPDTASVSSRFDWGNAPPTAEDNPITGATGARRFYTFASSTLPSDAHIQFEGQTSLTTSGIHPGSGEPTIDDGEAQQWRGALLNAAKDYAQSGYKVVTAEEAFLGPGQRAGDYNKQAGYPTYSHRPTHQRGGALVATLYDANGDPIEIAHVTVGLNGRAKGGGGGAQTEHQAQYAPSKAADVLKAKFVDRSKAVGVDLLAGALTYSSPATLDIGQGEFPERLTAQVFWRGGEAKQGLGPSGVIEPQAPWSTNWHNTLSVSGSAMEAMGATDVRASAGTITAFLAMQDIYRATPSTERDVAAQLVGSWWARQLTGNVVTATVGAETQQFVRLYNGTWLAPGPGRYATLTQTGQRAKYTKACGGTGYVQTRGWNYAGVSYAVTRANGDKQFFNYFENRIQPTTGTCVNSHGFRLTSWTFPRGINVTLTYEAVGGDFDRLKTISNNIGRSLTFNYTQLALSSITGAGRTISFAGDGVTSFTHTDPNNKATRFAVAVGPANRYQLQQIFTADDTATPALQYSYDSLSRVAQAKDRLAVLGQRNPYQFLISHGLRGERIDPAGKRYAVDYDPEKRAVRFTDELNRVVSPTYDGRGRTKSYTYPELDREEIEYDDRNNTTKLTKWAKPGSAEAATPIVIQATWDTTWNKIASITDAKNQVTDFTYYASGNGTGEMYQALRPPQTAGGARATYTFTYTAYGQLLRTQDPQLFRVENGYDATTKYLAYKLVDPGGNRFNYRTDFTNNPVGDPVDINGPRTDVADIGHAEYDNMRRKTLEIQPDPGTGRATAARTTYDDLGREIRSEQGYYANGTFTPLITSTTDYDAVGNKVRETTPAGITQYSYDAMNRVICTARRMNPDAAPPADACALAPRGPFGFDQIARNEYYDDGALKRMKMGLGTSAATDFVSYEYSANGQKTFVIDGVCNVTKLEYDGFDRLSKQFFPSATRAAGCQSPGDSAGHPGAWNANDYEAYGYDPNGNRTSLRKRDGKQWTYTHDTADRITLENYAADTNQSVNYTYFGVKVRAISYGTTWNAYKSIEYDYDNAGRPRYDRTYYVRQVAVGYDAAGNRTSITWPDTGFAVAYDYDAANRLTTVREAGTIANPRVLATFTYDDLGRRTHMYRGNGTQADYNYDDPAGRLTQLTQGGRADQPASVQTIAWTPAGQLASLTQASLPYVWQGQPSQNLDYTFNGLNQDAAIAGMPTPGFDLAGNLTNSGVRTYQYDARNRMTNGGNGAGSLSVAYDTLGRLRATLNSANTWTYFLYAGDKLVAEYADANAGSLPLRRYVFADGVDEPIVAYDGADNTQPRWLHADRQGSIIADSDKDGVIRTYNYSPYGEPGNGWSGSRFRYTGQVALPEIQAYFYKARIYDPAQGRFLQTDPIGQDDDPNLYAYVRGDPTNGRDPSGTELEANTCGRTGATGCAGSYETAGDRKAANDNQPKAANDNKPRVAAPTVSATSAGGIVGATANAASQAYDAGRRLGLKEQYEKDPKKFVLVVRWYGGTAMYNGRSWAPIDAVKDPWPRNTYGIPDGTDPAKQNWGNNTMQRIEFGAFPRSALSSGMVETRPALSYGSYVGGGTEYVVRAPRVEDFVVIYADRSWGGRK